MITTDPTDSIARIIRHTVAAAQDRGADSISRCRIAVAAVRLARPDMTEAEVWKVVDRVLAA